MSDQDLPLFFGEWLKRQRKQLDLTQTELAERACCSVFALRKIEAGDRRPSKQLAGMLAKTLDIVGDDQAIFIKVARGELGVEKLLALATKSSPGAQRSPIHENLPRALTPFVGREPELTALTHLLNDPHCSLLTIVGPGGIGKTRLAIEAVNQSNGFFPDGTWFVPLASLNSAIEIIPAIAYASGFKIQDPTNPKDQLLRVLRPKRCLLFLDNAEHLLESTEIFTEILSNCPQVKLLVTSRERLNLLSEWVFEIQGLPVPPNDQVKQFEAFSSIALFLQSARRVHASFTLLEADRQSVLKICQMMEGMPLGIELSAAWVGLLSIQDIANEIEHNLDFLSVSMHDLPERHRSLRASLDHSWKLLTDEEKLILSRLSVFRGGFHRAAAEKICGASLAVLSSLKNKTLLYRLEQNYYSLHELIRQYAGLKLAEHPEENSRIMDRHALYFVQYLADCEAWLQGSRQIATFDEMARIIDDLSLAWMQFVTHCHPGAGGSQVFPAGLLHSALFSLSLFYEMRCRSIEALTILKQSFEYLNGIQPEFEGTEDAASFNSVLGHVIAYLGLHHIYLQQYDLGRQYLEEAIHRLGDDHSRIERAQAMVMLAAIEFISGNFQLSVSLGMQSREIFREAGEEWWYALSCINLALALHSLGKMQEAKELYQEASRLVNPGDLRLKMPLITGFAYLRMLQNDFAGAEQMLQDALPLCDQLHSASMTGTVLYYLGRVAFATHRLELAESYYQRCVKINQEVGDSHDLAVAQLHLGNCYAAQGDHVAARGQFSQVITIGQEINQFPLVHYALIFIARMYITEGLLEQARDIFLVLQRCPLENSRMQDEFASLQAELQAALPDGQLAVAIDTTHGDVCIEEARAAVLAYVHDQENSW